MRPTAHLRHAFCVGMLLAFIPAGPTLADGPRVSVAMAGCEELDRQRVEELIATELDNTPGVRQTDLALAVIVVCGQLGITIEAQNLLTKERMEREFPQFSPSEAEPERAIALAVSQLITVSPPQPEEQEPVPDNDQETTDDVTRGEIAVAGGGRLRALGEMLPVAHLGLQGGGEFADGWFLFGLAAFEYGRAIRDVGDVRAYGILLGLGLAHRWPVVKLLALEVGASMAGGYGLLKGDPKRTLDIPGEVGGATGELALFAGPLLELGSFTMALNLLGGFTIRNPVGTVEGHADVSMGGLWVGGILRLGLRFGETRPRRN